MSGKKTIVFGDVFHDYMKDRMKLKTYQKWGILMLVIVVSGIFGWIYEFIFYFFDSGMQKFYMQGGDFLPWINIYAIGAILILFATWRLKRYPLAVFLVSVVTTGILEFVAGWLVYEVGGGTRYWDYNNEILNFGNIGGFVCFRSVVFFGLSALILMYLIVPFCIYLAQVMSKKAFLILAILLFAVVMVDEVGNLICKILEFPTAMDFYRGIGLEYKQGGI